MRCMTNEIDYTIDQYRALEQIATNESLDTPLAEQLFDAIEPPTEQAKTETPELTT